MSTPPLSAFRRLELTVRRRLDGPRLGEHAGSSLGSGSEPEELVLYSPGQDVRRIDWNASARNGDLYVWRTRAEHALETWILLDRSPSMAFGTVENEKSAVATWVAAAFGLLTRGSGDRVGLGLLDPAGLSWLAPGSGPVAARRVLGAPPAPRDGTSALALGTAIRQLNARAPRRGLRVIVSDLLDPAGQIEGPFGWQPDLRRLSARHDVVVVEILDPRELELPDVGTVTFVDPESGFQRQISTSDRRLRAGYADAAARHRRATAEAVRAAGAAHLVLRTDDDLTRTLTRFVDRRRRQPTRSPRR
jgi:uncharacterized protein (DUF58 family)